MPDRRAVSLVTLGCARNEVDSEELAARLADAGWSVTPDEAGAEQAGAEPPAVVLVNTCGFIEAAKQDSIDTLLAAAESGAKVVAAGCMAERYGAELAAALPEADAVLSFDDYASIGRRLDDVVAGRSVRPHQPGDRRRLLPLTPVERADARTAHIPGHGLASGSAEPAEAAEPSGSFGSDTSGSFGSEPSDSPGPSGPPDLPEGVAPASGPRPVLRRRLTGGPVAPLKIASGCDRRCTFCAIPAFRGSAVSRPAGEILAEAAWLADQGVRELVLVSENSTSYGKDLGDLRLLERLLPELAAVSGIDRVRVSYLQPAELRPGLLEVVADTAGVAPYFDLSFQHASGPLLRRMRRFGDRERFLSLLERVRGITPEAGVRSNFIVGFPGEGDDDLEELTAFLSAARLDAVGVFGYSDEEGTEAAALPGKLDDETIAQRVEEVTRLAEELTAQRAEERVGSVVEVLVEERLADGTVVGRAAHQAPEVDGTTIVSGADPKIGDMVPARVVAATGVDLTAAAIDAAGPR